MKFVILLAVIATTVAQECGNLQGRNIDDKDAALPWAVTLRERSTGDTLCMGTLISNQHVLIGNVFHHLKLSGSQNLTLTSQLVSS